MVGNAAIRGRALAGLVALLALVACSKTSTVPATTTSATSATPASTAATTSSPTSKSTPTTNPTTNKPQRNVLAWLLGLAPSAPKGPPQFEAYRALQERRCDAVGANSDFGGLPTETQALYRGAASACLAAFGSGDPAQRWAEAKRSYDAIAPHRSSLNCINVAAFSLLELLIREHDANPGGSFEVSNASPTKPAAPPCPHITGLVPPSGPPGTTVTVTGANLERVQTVRIVYDNGNEDPQVKLTRNAGSLIVVVKAGGGEQLACITLVTDPAQWNADGKLFAIQAAGSTAVVTPSGFKCPSEF